MTRRAGFWWGTLLTILGCLLAHRPAGAVDAPVPVVEKVALQPLAAHARALAEALEFTGAPLPEAARKAIEGAAGAADEIAGARAIQTALDPLCLAVVDINPEARVKVAAGPAAPRLMEAGWRTFLIKVHNQAGLTGDLKVESPQGKPLANSPADQVRDRWLEVARYTAKPLAEKLSGLEVEYRVVQMYSRDAGRRQATLVFLAGQGNQDLGFRSELAVMFTADAAREVAFRVKDEHGKPTTAALVIRDKAGHVYPSQAKRLAPDFFFQQQVYRADGETVKLPDGAYTLEVTRGPEYLPQSRALVVAEGMPAVEIALKRWIDPTMRGYWSGDHHIHAAGCAHYTQPTEGVLAEHMMRHIVGEDLKVGCNLTWGPCFDFQKQFFTGADDKVSTHPYLLRYDIEVSGFGSHRSGHLCLLRLKEQIYPGGDSKNHWPTLGLNTLKWAKKQGAVTGPAHSGNGIAVKDGKLPSYEVPDYNGIGANEFIVDVTHDVPGPDGKPVAAVDFISTVDTEPKAELNMWYHVLNCGYRVRASGETDFPCIYGERVGMGRSYVRLAGPLNYDAWCEGIRKGSNYVSDGYSHLIDMTATGEGRSALMGEGDSELRLTKAGKVTLKANVAAWMPQVAPPPRKREPVWSIERARQAGVRTVKVEAIVNGRAVAEQVIAADGSMGDVSFQLAIERSSWVALRVFPSSHTNPIFVVVDDKPVRASRRSAEWCLKGVEQCWSQKKRFYAPAEMVEAEAAYEHARRTYKRLIGESVAD